MRSSRHPWSPLRRRVSCCGWVFVLALNFSADAAETGGGQLASDWNRAVLEIAEAEDGFLTLKGVRTAAMMHLAMHDALNVNGGDFTTYALHDGRAAARPLLAVTEAAYQIVLSQYPEAGEQLSALRRKTIGESPPSSTSDSSLAVGQAAAAAVIAKRSGDGWDTEADYRWHPMAPGVYAEFNEHSGTPEGFIFGAGWAGARGFALSAPEQFRSPPPPDIDSAAYTRAFNEVKSVGRFQSMERTPDQTHLALWWKDFAESSHNRLARKLVAEEQLSLSAAVRLFALVNAAIFDAYVSSFENKFHYNHWRPYTAIRWAANDGNSDTVAEETWTNTHRHTYAFPSYPSAHGTACAAAMAAFEDVFGDDYAFVMRTETVDIAGPFSGKINMQPATREFASFSEAATECGLSRVYLGIHFRYDSTAGVALGRDVGSNVVRSLLMPAASPATAESTR